MLQYIIYIYIEHINVGCETTIRKLFLKPVIA
jgi:hypothetical protein